jgi:hypothetical protein
LPFTVTLLDTNEHAAEEIKGKRSLEGQTSDLSETGLTLLLKAVRIGKDYLTDMEHYLGIKLLIPGEPPVSMLAVPTRFEDLNGAESEFRYLLGVRIIRMQEGARASYLMYLRAIEIKDRRTRKQTHDAAKTVAPAAQSAGQGNAWANVTPSHVSEAYENFLRESLHPRELQSAGQGNAWTNVTPARVSEAFENFLRDNVHKP